MNALANSLMSEMGEDFKILTFHWPQTSFYQHINYTVWPWTFVDPIALTGCGTEAKFLKWKAAESVFYITFQPEQCQ